RSSRCRSISRNRRRIAASATIHGIHYRRRSHSMVHLFCDKPLGSSPLLALDTFAIKFQGDLGSFQFEGNGGNGTVPAPATVILLGMSILGMWLVARRP
ncbi:MAG: PEP-CTERM sorting domain-containing protein, partial [Candidatus Rokuibacteriota bacterium]